MSWRYSQYLDQANLTRRPAFVLRPVIAGGKLVAYPIAMHGTAMGGNPRPSLATADDMFSTEFFPGASSTFFLANDRYSSPVARAYLLTTASSPALLSHPPATRPSAGCSQEPMSAGPGATRAGNSCM